MIAFHWKGAVVLHVSQTWHFLAFSIIFLFIIAGTCLQITVYRSDCLYQHTIFWNDSFAEDFLPVFFSESLQPVGNLFYRFKLRLRLFSFWIWLTICWDQVSSQDSTLPVVEDIMFIVIGDFSDLDQIHFRPQLFSATALSTPCGSRDKPSQKRRRRGSSEEKDPNA